jgi:exocyst complex component 1
MHKARENANGSFSIGKTWVLDDLTAIQSYSAFVPANRLDQQHKEWASSVGFLVTIGKPYYWQAATAKEKDFFIASLVKIFKKYTGGKTPELNGFTKEESEALIGGALPQAQPQGRAPPARPERSDRSELSAPPRPSSAQGRPPIISSRNRAPSRDPSRERGPGSNPYAARPPSREVARESGSQAGHYNRAPSREGNYEQQPPPPPYFGRAPSREGSREPRQKPSEELFLRKKASREQMQRIPGQYPSGRPQHDLTPQSSHSQLSRDQTSSPANFRNLPNGFSPTPPPAPQSDTSSRNLGNAPSIESFDTAGSKQSKTIPRDTNQFPTNKAIMNLERKDSPYQRPESPQTEDRNVPTKSSTPPAPDTNQEQVPERRRPPFQGPNLSFGQKSMRRDSNEKFSTPMGTPGIQETDGRAPSRGSDRATPGVPTSKATSYFTAPVQKETPGANAVTSKASVTPSEPPQTNGDPDSLVAVHDALSAPTPFSETSTPTAEQKEEEAFRPGLGPMMKKKSSKDIAKTFRKAATAYGALNAFKPRAGGAGEKFLAEKEKMTTEPDGITGVVPAPLQRGVASDGSRSGTPDLKDRPLSPTSRERPFSPMGITFKQEPPKVQITRTATDEIQSTGDPREAESADSPEHSRSVPPGQAETRRKRKSDNSAKYLNALGIDPVILEGRGTEFDSVLTELGWNGRLSDDKKVEELEADVRREIGRVQAGSWLGHMEQQEGKIDQLSKMFDRCAEECEELDGLLTLYAHELNVGSFICT